MHECYVFVVCVCTQVSEVSLPSLEEETRKRTMKHFAGGLLFIFAVDVVVLYLLSLSPDMELQRRKSEKNLHAHNARERMKEEEEKEKVSPAHRRYTVFPLTLCAIDRQLNKKLSIKNGPKVKGKHAAALYFGYRFTWLLCFYRREKRVGNWREFNGVSSVQPETGPRVSGMASGQFTTSAAATATAAAKRPRLATAQREERAAAVGSAPKFGQVELEAWKKTWK